MANNNLMTFAVVVMVIAALAVVGYLFGWIPGQSAADGGTGGASGGAVTVETCPEDVSLRYNDQDADDRTNDPAGTLWMFNPDRGSIADDGSETMGTNVEFEGIANNASTTYYASYVKGNTGCTDPMDFAPKVVRTGTLTVSAFNSDDGEPNTASDTQAISANDEDLEMEVCYDTVSNRYFGAPQAEGKSVVVVAYNQTVINSVEVAGANRGDTPASYNRVTANKTAEETWEIANVVDGEKQCINLNIDATSTEPPAGTITLSFYDANVDLDQSKYVPIYDVEDEDNNLLSIQQTNKTIYIS